MAQPAGFHLWPRACNSSLTLGSISIGGSDSSSEWRELKATDIPNWNLNLRLKWIRALARRFTLKSVAELPRNEEAEVDFSVKDTRKTHPREPEATEGSDVNAPPPEGTGGLGAEPPEIRKYAAGIRPCGALGEPEGDVKSPSAG